MPERNAAQRLGGEAVAARPADRIVDLLSRYGPVVAGYALPFLLIVYVSLKGGAYDPIVRSELGIAVWWVVLLGVGVGALPLSRMTSGHWCLLGALLALAAWTALATSWSESSERTVAELARVATYIGVFALATLAQGRDALRRTVLSVAAAIALVGVLALASRLHPSWFPESDTARFLSTATSRLNYPLNYWNGLAALIAIGVPLLLWVATEARFIATRALAAAAIPALCLAGFFTLSRGGAVELALALVVLVALHPRRLALLPTLLTTAIGSALLISAGAQREALTDGLTNGVAATQGDEMFAVALVVCAGVALIQAAIALAARYGIGPRLAISRRATGIGTVAVAAVVAVLAIASGLPGELDDRWQEFKQPTIADNTTVARFESASGHGRYQYWDAAVDAFRSEPLTGIGPGTYEFWWAREASIPGFVRDAHSLYLETLAELGLVGLLLVAGLVFGVIAFGTVRALRQSPGRRALLATALAACSAFATAAAIDWVWELAVLPIVFLILAAGILARPDNEERPSRSSGGLRIAFALVSLAALAAIAIPLAGSTSVRASQQQVNAANLTGALDDAQSAQDLQPYAATPSLQEALVRELSGDLDAAAKAAADATEDEPTNWRTWLVLSRIEASRGNVGASIDAYVRARRLNPRSPLFQ